MARWLAALTLFAALFLATLTHGVSAQGGAPVCRITGRITSGTIPLPGVALVVRTGNVVTAATSTSLDGQYEIALPAGDYAFTAELTGFTRVDRSIDMTSCGHALDLQLVVAPRATTPAAAAGRGGRGRFETLTLARQAAADTDTAEADNPVAQLALPPGFSTEGPTDAVAVNGNAANVDRGQLNDRLDALARGDFAAPPVDIAAAGAGGFGGFGGGGAPGAGGRGPIPGGGGGPGLGGGARGGRGGPFGGRGQQPFTFTGGYTLGGSALDAAPYQLRPGGTAADPQYLRQNFDLSAGGPVRIPGLYNGTRRTSFTVNYSRSRGDTLFDQYATVPTAAMRGGDFSALARSILDPATGLPFDANQIPQGRIDQGSTYLLRFIPAPNLPGTSRNYHYVTTTNSASDNVNVRVTHNFTPNAAGPGGRGGGGARGAGGGGRGRGVQAGTTAAINGQVQYRRNDNERNNVFPTLGGANTGSTLAVPVTLNIGHARMQHSVNVNFSKTHSATTNQYAFIENVAAAAGIAGVATDPFDWGVPTLSFASLSSVNDLTPAIRDDSRLSLGYTWSRPSGRHVLRAGAEMRRDVASSRTDSNASGTFVFTGLYSGSDFADFLLGTPQQASVHYGPGSVDLHGRSMSLFAQDDWRRSGSLTFNFGLRYELTWPLVEGNGQLVNLDAASDFSAVTPVMSGGTGRFSGPFPDALIRTDINNLAPRVGVAWRAAQGTVVRGGYGVSYNAGTYSQIARQLASQPPFAVTDTSIGSAISPLPLEDAFAAAAANATTNNFGVDPSYQLGRVQTANVDVTHNLTRTWTAGGGYTFAVGSNLDLVRAPNRGPSGLRIEGVEPFLWQTSESASRLHSATFRLRRRNVRGIGGGLTYTRARSRDNASTIGGATVVAQNDQDLNEEWGLSSFNRAHQLQANANIELPFGPNRRWLSGGGFWAGLLEAWSANLTLTVQSGTPLTPRVLSSASDAARGTNGTLRADYNGQPIAANEPTIDRFFNTAAFSLPSAGAFGTAGRNIIIGPGSRDLSAQFSRDVTLAGSRNLSIQLRASNLLNLVNYAAVDTTVNSPSFGQVTSVRPMRSMQIVLRFRY